LHSAHKVGTIARTIRGIPGHPFARQPCHDVSTGVKVSLSSWAGEEPGCLSCGGTVVVPKDASGDKAKITLSFTDWKEGGVASRTCDIAISDPKPIGKPK